MPSDFKPALIPPNSFLGRNPRELIFPLMPTVETIEQIKSRAESAVPGAQLAIIANDSPAKQPSLLVDVGHALAVARFLRDDPELRLDYASNVTGVDWLDTVLKEKVKVKKTVDGVEKEVEEVFEKKKPGYLEAVYHLFSMTLKQGP